MIKVVIEKKCPQCGLTENFFESVSDVQMEWLRSHPVHPIHCVVCGNYGLDSRAIDLSLVRVEYEKGRRLNEIAKGLDLRVTTAARGLTVEQRREWRTLRRAEINAAKATKESIN